MKTVFWKLRDRKILRAIQICGICLWIVCICLVAVSQFVFPKARQELFSGVFIFAGVGLAAVAGVAGRRIKAMIRT